MIRPITTARFQTTAKLLEAIESIDQTLIAIGKVDVHPLTIRTEEKLSALYSKSFKASAQKAINKQMRGFIKGGKQTKKAASDFVSGLAKDLGIVLTTKQIEIVEGMIKRIWQRSRVAVQREVKAKVSFNLKS